MTCLEEALAPSGRVLARKMTTVATGQVTENVIYGYDGPGDSPAWTAPAGTDFSAVVTYLDGAWFYGPVPIYELANAHGDIVGTAYQNGTFTPGPVADEYGNGTPPTSRRGWLGANDRFTTHTGLRLYRMGVRLYDPTTGRFTQPDPVEGGSANNYDYVQADPLNSYDLDGEAKRRPKQQKKKKSSLQRRVNEHRGKIRNELRKANPNRGRIKHWEGEIRGWQGQIDKINGRRHRRSRTAVSRVFAATVAIWWAGKVLSPACGPAMPICAVGL